MPNVFASITMSLDGFIAGVNDDSDQPLGENGENLHDWILEGDYPSKHNDFFKLSKENRDIFDDMFASTGVLIAGRRTYDIVHGWEGSYPVSGIPAFVLTHTPPSEVPDGHTPFTFVTEGIQHAIKQAKASAGNKNVKLSVELKLFSRLSTADFVMSCAFIWSRSFWGRELLSFKI